MYDLMKSFKKAFSMPLGVLNMLLATMGTRLVGGQYQADHLYFLH